MDNISKTSINVTLGKTNVTETKKSSNWKLWIHFLSAVGILDDYMKDLSTREKKKSWVPL